MGRRNRAVALEGMYRILHTAISNARAEYALAERQAAMARRIGTRQRIRAPYELRISFCKGCKRFIAPGVNSRTRIGRSAIRAVRTTCLFCGHVHRRILAHDL